MNRKHYTVLLILQVCLGQPLWAQFYNMPDEYNFSLLTEKSLAHKDTFTHTGIKPYIPFFSTRYIHVEDSHRVYKYVVDDPGLESVFHKHVVRIEPRNYNFKLRLDPVLNFEGGHDFPSEKNKTLYTNTRGFIGSGYIGSKVYFETMFAENQSMFPDYLTNIAKATGVIPGQGRWKDFKIEGFDYAFSSGFVSLQPLKNLNIQFGHGKQKIGHGYRSLLLSDNAFNYPYVRFTQQWFRGRVQYSNIYAVLMNLTGASVKGSSLTERLFQKKAASFQYLSITASKSLSFGLFQGLIWQAGNERNRQEFDWHYFNPVIYTNLPAYGLNSKNNLLAGADLKLKLTDRLNVYAQLMADDLSNSDSLGNGWGYQAGINYFDAFGIKNLVLQCEFNYASQTAYQSPEGIAASQQYRHYSQPLAFTPGAGQELVLMADYKYRRWIVNMRYNYQDVPSHNKTYYLNNIFNARLGYVINPAYNLNLSLGYTYRNQNFYYFRTLNNETGYLFLSLRTSLYNFYYDF